MRIRTQFVITMFLFGVVLVAISAWAIITNHQVEKADEQEEIASTIAQGVSELSYLSNDYLINRGSQQLKRWRTKFASFSRDVARLQTHKPDQQALVHNIQANTLKLKEVFDSVVSGIDSPALTGSAGAGPSRGRGGNINLEFLRVSWSRMAVQIQVLNSDATQLWLLLARHVNRVQRTNTGVVIALIGVFLSYFLVNYLVTQRRVLKGITKLQAGTAVIGSGDLDFAIEEQKNDEIGDLSRAFNKMAASLKRVTASKTDLEREILVREQVEEALRQRSLELQQLAETLEQRVQDRTAELQKSNEALGRSNRELEDFAHVASHDLQEPLRKIRTFADRLVTMQQDSLDEKARDYLIRMQHAAGRMQSLIQDLLRYSRITSRPNPFKLGNLRVPVEEAVTDLMVLFGETGGSIEIDELPEVEADHIQMRQLFQNLISNGLKYRGEERPVIRMYSKPSSQEGFHEIHVKDNGIGFDESNLDKIFKPFQRLHGKSAPYQGTGMGLAICRRILEHHGGNITARSKPGEGASFIVRLPKSHPHKS